MEKSGLMGAPLNYWPPMSLRSACTDKEAKRETMRIYLSSTYEDLEEYRRTVYTALRKAGHEVFAMEEYVACDERPLDKCLNDVAKTDLYVGLFAFRYGYVPPAGHENKDSLSITELEYRSAANNPSIRCITYVLDESVPWPNIYKDSWTGKNETGQSIERLREYLCTETLTPSFTSPHQLASEVQAAVSRVEKSIRHESLRGVNPEREITWDIKQCAPYPGLRRFTRRYSRVFFGRDADVRAILDRLNSPFGRFLIVSGDSGSGKSSLIDAGVLPNLEKKGESTSDSCRAVYFRPNRSNDVFHALLSTLQNYAEVTDMDPFGEVAEMDPVSKADELAENPEKLPQTLHEIVVRGFDHCNLVLFLDQMEELFTGAGDGQRLSAINDFLTGLYQAASEGTLSVIATIRGDFLHHCHRIPALLTVLRGSGHYPLGGLEAYMLHDMITKPAQCAGLYITDSLAWRLVRDAGTEPGSLPLLAFVLRRLFDEREDSELSEAIYDRLSGSETNGMQGVLANYATEVERQFQDAFGKGTSEQLLELFSYLLTINVEGVPTRRWASESELPGYLRPIVELLVTKRLLTKVGKGEAAAVSIAHEKLFDAWPVLTRWIAKNKTTLATLSMAVVDATQWRTNEYDLVYLWHPERLKQLQQTLEQIPKYQTKDLKDYAWPGVCLVELLENPSLSDEERLTIGHYLAQLGDPRPGIGLREDGVPDIDWVAIPGGHVLLEADAGEKTVKPFEIARYPVTHTQYQIFIDSPDGYRHEAWWMDLDRQNHKTARWAESNAPRENVAWQEAVAYCRWLSNKLGYLVRLPDEFEWQHAATRGDRSRNYPWGEKWKAKHCNSAESGLNRTTAVGLYPHGTWLGGPLDMAGNVQEWCSNKFRFPTDSQIDRLDDVRVLRGGAWSSMLSFCSASSRSYGDSLHDETWFDPYGFRVMRPSSFGA